MSPLWFDLNLKRATNSPSSVKKSKSSILSSPPPRRGEAAPMGKGVLGLLKQGLTYGAISYTLQGPSFAALG